MYELRLCHMCVLAISYVWESLSVLACICMCFQDSMCVRSDGYVLDVKMCV